MIRRTILSVFILLSLIVPAASAQQVGSWNMYQVFSGNDNKKLIDTDSQVYFLSDGWLYSYDKENEELVYHNKINNLSDTYIKDIFYNYDKKFLFVAYSNSNIDLIFDNGRVENIPDLKNVVMTSEKAINSVDFLDKYAYVATDFGYMVVDCEKFIIKESFNYGKKFNSMIATDKYLYANFDKKSYVSDINASHYEISAFQLTNFSGEAKMTKLGNDAFIWNSGWCYLVKTGLESAKLSIFVVEQKESGSVTKTGDNFLASFSGYYYIFDKDGNQIGKTALPENVDGSLLSAYAASARFWNLDKGGLSQFEMADDGSMTILHESMRPNATTVVQPYFMAYKGHKLYEMNTGPNFLGADNTGGYPFSLSMLEDGVWKDISPANPTFINGNSKNKLCRACSFNIEEDGAVWFSTWWEGIYCVNDRKQLQKFDNTNSPLMLKEGLCCSPDFMFDSKGNLWALYFNLKNTTYSQLFMLPAAKKYSETVQESDWISWNFGDLEMTYRSKMFIKDDRYVLFVDNDFKTRLMVLDNNGTPENTADDKQTMISSFVDQDGKVFEIGYMNCFIEDENGRIWIGTNSGIGVINNIQAAFSNSLVINRIKVARNDGTNLADYLLDGMTITGISIDGANRKWIGTTTSGLYLVSADGSEILDHFTLENSMLVDDLVTSVVCNTDNSKVYVGTKKGTMIYQSDASPSKSDFSNVYAYPNPVRPDYTGYITVAGLMDNSLVKISDAAGNVVYSGKSTGGMFVWNGCGNDGSRVDTGVYYVFASQSENDSSSGYVTKILIVR